MGEATIRKYFLKHSDLCYCSSNHFGSSNTPCKQEPTVGLDKAMVPGSWAGKSAVRFLSPRGDLTANKKYLAAITHHSGYQIARMSSVTQSRLHSNVVRVPIKPLVKTGNVAYVKGALKSTVSCGKIVCSGPFWKCTQQLAHHFLAQLCIRNCVFILLY